MFQRTRMTLNLLGAAKRYEMLEGKQYLVIPTVSLTEGVHCGDQGPIYYPPDEIARDFTAWNHHPAVVNHPQLNGEGVSACDPLVVENQRVGVLFNSSFDGRLKHETWLDPVKLAKVDNRVLDAINNNQMVEVSTGIFLDVEDKPGEWHGEKYIGVARNIRPDHLAILPDTVGACSIKDGAGLLRNDGSELSYKDIRDQIGCLLKAPALNSNGVLSECPYCWVCDLYKNYAVYESGDKYYKIGYKIKNSKVSLVGDAEEVQKVTSYVANEDQQGPLRSIPAPNFADLSDKMKQMQGALETKYSGIQQQGGSWGGWVTEVESNYTIFYKDGKLFRLPYTYKDAKIEFGTGEPEEIERTSTFRAKTNTPIDGTLSPPQTLNQESKVAALQNVLTTPGKLMGDETKTTGDTQARTTDGGARASMVNSMIAGGRAKEEDRGFLMSLPDDGFVKVQKWVMEGATQTIVPYGYAGIGDRSNAPGVSNQQGNQMLTAQQYIANAPPEIRELLSNSLAEQVALKARLVKQIVSNSANPFSEAWLMQKDMNELKGLAMLSRGGQQPQQQQVGNSYAGQGDVPMFNTAAPVQVDNAAGDDEILTMPSVWDRAAK